MTAFGVKTVSRKTHLNLENAIKELSGHRKLLTYWRLASAPTLLVLFDSTHDCFGREAQVTKTNPSIGQPL